MFGNWKLNFTPWICTQQQLQCIMDCHELTNVFNCLIWCLWINRNGNALWIRTKLVMGIPRMKMSSLLNLLVESFKFTYLCFSSWQQAGKKLLASTHVEFVLTCSLSKEPRSKGMDLFLREGIPQSYIMICNLQIYWPQCITFTFSIITRNAWLKTLEFEFPFRRLSIMLLCFTNNILCNLNAIFLPISWLVMRNKS